MRKLSEELLMKKIEGSLEGIWGGYWILHPKIKDHAFYCRVGDGLGWDHVSISMWKKKGNKKGKVLVKRCPTWDEMCYIKNIFFLPSEVVVQYHPASSEYINNHEYVLHLWRPQVEKLPNPLPVMV